jgi:GT2 family glycosyltransferase
MESIVNSTYYPIRLIIIDNGSGKETEIFLKEFTSRDNIDSILIRNRTNQGFIRAINQGLEISSSPFVCLLNNDTVVTNNWLTKMINLAQSNSRIGIVNPIWYGQDGCSIEEYAKVLEKNVGQYMEVNDCMGFCMLIKREVIEKIGLLDEIFGRGGREDSDYSKRAILAGYRCIRTKDTFVFHRENTSFNRIGDWRRERVTNNKIFEQRWGKRKQIVFIFEKDISIDKLKVSLSLARVGVRVHIWALLDRKSKILNKEYLQTKGINEHNNIKYFYFFFPQNYFLREIFKIVFYILCFLKLLSRRNKNEVNKYKAVFISKMNLRRFLMKLKPLHKVRTYFNLENCPVLEQELKWMRSLN